MSFASTSVAEHGVLILTPQGEMDVHTAPVLAQAALDAMDKTAPDILIDLSELTFMDCSGVTVLLAIRREAMLRGGRVSLRHAQGGVDRLLRLTGVNRLFTADAEAQILLPPSEDAAAVEEEIRS